MAALGLLVSTAAWSQSTTASGTSDQETASRTTTPTQTSTDVDVDRDDRPRLSLSGFAGYTFNDGLDFDSAGGLTPRDVSFYNSIGPSDRFSYGAALGYEVTPNLEIGALWTRMSSQLEMRGFDAAAAVAAGWSGPTGTGTGGVGTGGTGTGGTSTGGTASFPVLTTTNGATPYEIGELDVNTFHGTIGWNFGDVDAAVRPFIFGGAGVTRYGELEYQFANPTAAAGNPMITARLDSDTRFSTTWGVGLKIAPTRGLGVRVAGRWTPTRLSAGGASTGTSTTGGSGSDQGWWCSGQWGCFANESRFFNHFSLTGGLVLRF